MRRTFRSLSNPNLIVVDKERGGKADSLNAGLNLARYPLFAAVDADSMLDGEAILRASRLFVEDETLVAVGGTIGGFLGPRFAILFVILAVLYGTTAERDNRPG